MAAGFLEQVLDAWRVNSEINLALVSAIPRRGLAVVPLNSRGRPVARQLAHMQNVHVGWLKYNGFPTAGLPRLGRVAEPTRAQLRAGLRASGDAVQRFLRERLSEGGNVRWFAGEPVRWMAYLIAHDSHHRGQIALALKQAGMRLPGEVAINDLWYRWYWDKKKR